MYLLYDLLLMLSALALVPYYLLRGLRHGKMRRGIRERIGFYSGEQRQLLRNSQVIWVHAVSVGETRAAAPLIRALKKEYPDHLLVLSNVTETGREIAGNIPEIDLCLFFPFDLSFVVRRVLSQVNIKLAVIVETEIWPNFVRILSARKVPLFLVNGRISDRSFPRYLKVKSLLKPILESFRVLCMQTQLDARRIRMLGAASERVEVTGNLKFDMKPAEFTAAGCSELRDGFHIPSDAVLWVAGSTHAGEEEQLVSVYHQLLAEGEKLFLVLVPRHPERCRTLLATLVNQGKRIVLRSEVNGSGSLSAGEILLVDTLGEMLRLYAVADLVFVGGSLVPIGGHNVLEASLMQKPVVFGPHMQNFKEISRLLLGARGGICVQDKVELLHAIRRLVKDSDYRLSMGGAGLTLLQQNVGATSKTLNQLRSALEP